MMAKLICTPLGYTARDRFCAELQQLEYGQGVLVLPNRLLMQQVQQSACIETVSIDALANKILNSNGYTDFKLVNRNSQEIVVKDLITYLAQQEQLAYFGTLAEKPGFVKAMTSLVGQLSRTGVTEKEIVHIITSWDREGRAAQKDAEVAQLYALYRQYLKNKNWFDLEGKYRLAIWVMQKPQARYIWRQLYFSDFYSFDSLQLAFIRELAQHCRVTIGMSYDKEREKLFAASRATYQDLAEFCEVEKYTLPVTAGADWQQLAKGLGRSCAPVPAANVRTCAFTSREEEMRWVLGQVKQQLQQGTAPGEVLVAVRDLAAYSGLRLLADEYGIPVTLAQTTALAAQPLVEMLLLLLQCAPDTRQGAEAYGSLLDAGLVRLLAQAEVEQAAALRQNFYFTSRSQAQQIIHEQLPQADAVWELLDTFIAETQAHATLPAYAEQLVQLVQELQLEQRLGGLHRAGSLTLEAVAACLQAKEVLLKAVAALLQDYEDCDKSEEKITLREWQDILAEAVAQQEVVLRPGRQDGVLITEATNVLGLYFEQVYILGLREGEFPKAGNENWLYNDKERGELQALGLDMPNTALSYAEDEYFFAGAVLAAKQGLTLTWHEDDATEKSPYIEDIQKLFTNVQEERPVAAYPSSPQELAWQGAACDNAWLQAQVGAGTLSAAAADSRRRAEAVYNGVLAEPKLQQQVRRQVGSSFSASGLEIYAQCPFRFLGERVWGQQAFAEAEDVVQPADEGSLLHEVLARFLGAHLQENLYRLSPEVLEQELQELFAAVCTEYEEQGTMGGVLWQAEKPRLWCLLQRWLSFEYADQQRWQFRPCAVEWDFSSKNGRPLPLQLADGSSVRLDGRIDRLDSDGCRLFLTDYKRSVAPTGKDLQEGFDLQLPLYLLAAAQLYRGKLPVAGASYFVLKNGIRSSKLVLEEVGNSDLPYNPKKNPLTQSWQGFQDFCEQLLQGYIEQIYQGNFAVAPRRECSPYCSLQHICRINILQGGRSAEADD